MKAMFRKSVLAAALAVGYAASAQAAIDPSEQLSFSFVSADAAFPSYYSGALLKSQVEGTGFAFKLLGTGSYGYQLVLEVGGQFASQTGLLGYAVSTTIGGTPTWYTLMSSPNLLAGTFQLPLTMPTGDYTVSLGPVPKATAGRQGLIFQPLVAPVPSVPEPESCAMLLAGLGVVATVARRRKGT